MSDKETKDPNKSRVPIQSAAIRFAGDSGDGMQLSGSLFAEESAHELHDVATMPDFPAEIRAPAGSVSGVSAFQIHFGSQRIYTPGDQLDALVAMNPAALMRHLDDLKQNGILICNTDSFTEKNIARAGFDANPLEDPELETKYHLLATSITSLTAQALSEFDLPKASVERCKNFFSLGILCWLFGLDVNESKEWIDKKFGAGTVLSQANTAALDGGRSYAEALETFGDMYEVAKADLEAGCYRNMTGNQGLALGLVAASHKSKIRLVYSSYPITPATEILQELAKHKDHGVVTFQAEDEIAACCTAIGASFSGSLGVTGSSGPGLMLKQEAIGLAVMAELPLVVIDVQRAGPSTGMPTKPEQADLLAAIYGRHGECPVVALAVACPEDAFEVGFEACKIAIEHMVPVIVLSDGYIGNASHPWRIPDVEAIPEISPPFASADEASEFLPYRRDPDRLARKWAKPGTTGLEHRIGGIEKLEDYGSISYLPENHEKMVAIRAEKVERVANYFKGLSIFGDPKGKMLLVSWGSTYGATAKAAQEARSNGLPVAHVHLRHLNPLHPELLPLLNSFENVLVPELNSGQLAMILRARSGRQIDSYSKIQGQPLRVSEVYSQIEEACR